MTNKKSTKRALMSSVVSLILCFSMLLGTTYAWFTDTVTSGTNIIAAGNLDIELYHENEKDDKEQVTSATVLFDEVDSDRWEPGSMAYEKFTIENLGNLALKYQFALLTLNETVEGFADVLKVAVIEEDNYDYSRDTIMNDTSITWESLESFVRNGTMEEQNATEVFGIVIWWKSSEDDNKFNLSNTTVSVDVSVVLTATQLANEEDGFGTDYDEPAPIPEASLPVTLPETVTETITLVAGENATTKVDLPVEAVGAIKELGAQSVAIQHSEPKFDNDEKTVTFESFELVDQNGDIIDLTENTNAIKVTLNVSDVFTDGEVVVVYHDNVAVGEATVTNGMIEYETTHFCEIVVSQLFEDGQGTAEDPYIINTADDLWNIPKYYHEYKYYKVADGIESLDLTGIGKLKLNGSFDGNGVTMNNLTTALFEVVGKVGEEQDIKISNLTANINSTDGRAFVRNIYNPGTTTFENVAIHGYIEGQYNMGSFYNYGTANAGDSEGADYTVSFVKATSDATIVCTTGNAIGGMLGHGFEGANYKLSINMDEESGYTGKMYTTGTATCYQVMAMCSHANYILNGVETSRYTNVYPSTKLVAATPEAKDDGYYVAPVDGVDHYVVSLEAQLTAYDENGVKIPNMAGLTWSLGKETIAEGFAGKLFDLFTSAEIVNNKNIAIGYEINDGVLKVYTGRDTNYASGWITLNVTQYDAEGTILATGNVRVHTFEEPTFCFTADQLKAALEAGKPVVLMSDVAITETLSITKDAYIDGNGKTIRFTTSGSTNRFIDVPKESNGANLTIKNVVIDIDGSYCQRGINYNTNGELILDNVTLTGTTKATYGINLPSGSANATVEMTNCDITALIALNVWGENAVINVTNCKLSNFDNNSTEGENYATVKLNNNGTDSAEGSVITIKGGTIIAKDETGADFVAINNNTSTGDIVVSDTTVVEGIAATNVAIVRFKDGNGNFYNEFYGTTSLQSAVTLATKNANAEVFLLTDITVDTLDVPANVIIHRNGHALEIGATTGAGTTNIVD